ncbi:MAG: hypothetical protein ABJ034_00660 [Hyphomicrobiales bacterium]
MSEISQNTEEERRAAPRARALKKGTIAFKERYCSAECMVRNESESGALLMVSQNQVIPNVFELKVYPERDFRIVEAIWRTPDAMGVRYAGQVPAAPVAAPAAPVVAPPALVVAPAAPVAAPAAPVAAPAAPVAAHAAPVAAPAAPVVAPDVPVVAPDAPVAAPVAAPITPSVPVDASSVPVAAPAAPSAPVAAPNPHSTCDGIERRKQNRRQTDRRS